MITACPEGENHLKVHQASKTIAAKWNAMTLDEQRAAAEPLVQELKAAKKENHAPVRNSAISAFHDARATWSVVKTEVSAFRPSIIYIYP